MKQVRVKIEDLKRIIRDLLYNNLDFDRVK